MSQCPTLLHLLHYPDVLRIFCNYLDTYDWVVLSILNKYMHHVWSHDDGVNNALDHLYPWIQMSLRQLKQWIHSAHEPIAGHFMCMRKCGRFVYYNEIVRNKFVKFPTCENCIHYYYDIVLQNTGYMNTQEIHNFICDDNDEIARIWYTDSCRTIVFNTIQMFGEFMCYESRNTRHQLIHHKLLPEHMIHIEHVKNLKAQLEGETVKRLKTE